MLLNHKKHNAVQKSQRMLPDATTEVDFWIAIYIIQTKESELGFIGLKY